MRCLALLVLVLASADAARITPVQQVLDMMNDMKAKGEASMEEESKIFATYSEWVSDQSTELGFEMKTAKSDIEKLIAFIDKADSDAAELGEGVASLDAETAQLESDLADATALRESEHAEYLKVAQDYGESVDALARAIDVLKAQNYDRPQAMMLLQKMASKTAGMRRVLAALEETSSEPGAPEVAAYESQSGGVIGMLEKLFAKFKDELATTEEEEANRAHAYDLEKLHLSDSIKQNTADREEKSVNKATLVSESGAAKGDLAATRTDLAEDEKLLADTHSTYEAKKSTYEENQKVRAGELEAIAKAIEIISDPKVSGSYSEHVKLVQIAKAPMFLQERSQSASARAASKQRALELIRSRAETLSSKVLAQLASELAANPFAKVVDMIKSLLAKLKEEAAAEAAHKKWCDDELKANKLKRDKKTSKVGMLQATVDNYSASIQDMADEIALLSKEQADLAKAMAEATAMRTKESNTNANTVKDAVAAKEAVKQALTVLKEFYASQASLLQQAPEMAEYKGMGSAKGGVVGMLEVIESDFARLETDTLAAEARAADENKTFMADSKAAKKEKHDRETQLKLDKDQAEFEMGRTRKDLDSTQVELDKANEYYESLKPNCLEVHVSYEERVARRKQEIESLKEAYNILDQQ